VNPESAGVLAQMLGKGLGREPSKGTMLAVAILLFWVAGVLFFVAFEASGILGENVPAGGGGGVSYFKAILSGIGAKAAQWGGGVIGQGPVAGKPPTAGEGG
jgi:hypothetical protein